MSLYEPIESTDSRRHLQLRSPVTLETYRRAGLRQCR